MFSRIRHWRRRTPRERALRQLELLPRHTRTATDLLGRALEVPDAASFLAMYREIWEQEIYRFTARAAAPYIIDGGANIGVSVLYFKRTHPQSRIKAFEPDPQVFAALQNNVAAFGLENVELFPQALWSSTGQLHFQSEGADAGKIAEQGRGAISIPSLRLRDLLFETVDFLKLDIEGAETQVLADCADVLHHVERLFVEYHSFADQPQTIGQVFDILIKSGMRVHVHCGGTSPQPFQQRTSYNGMDLQLNIFGFRE